MTKSSANNSLTGRRSPLGGSKLSGTLTKTFFFQVMDDMNGIMTGSFSKKDRLKFDKFQTNLKNFQTVVKDLIKTHARQRFGFFFAT